jgi:hypothetical protein
VTQDDRPYITLPKKWLLELMALCGPEQHELRERVLESVVPAPGFISDEQVQRFLTWPVPADVYPDGIPGQPGRTGTNLLSAQQARQMLEHVMAREG